MWGYESSEKYRMHCGFELFTVEFGVGTKPGEFQFLFIIINSVYEKPIGL